MKGRNFNPALPFNLEKFMPTCYYNGENDISPGQGVILFHTQDGDKYIKLTDVRSCSLDVTDLFENKRFTCDVGRIEVCFCNKNFCNKNQEVDESEIINLLEE